MNPANVVRLPCEIPAGDSLAFRATLPDYPASQGWSLTYTLAATSGVYSIPTTADGDAHVVAVAAATTAAYAAGRYRVQATVSNGTDRHTVDAFDVRVLPNLVAAVAPVDTRSHARKVLDAIEEYIETGSATAASVQIGIRQVQNIPLPELLAFRDRYRIEVRREESGGRNSRILTSL